MGIKACNRQIERRQPGAGAVDSLEYAADRFDTAVPLQHDHGHLVVAHGLEHTLDAGRRLATRGAVVLELRKVTGVLDVLTDIDVGSRLVQNDVGT